MIVPVKPPPATRRHDTIRHRLAYTSRSGRLSAPVELDALVLEVAARGVLADTHVNLARHTVHGDLTTIRSSLGDVGVLLRCVFCEAGRAGCASRSKTFPT